jgi:membrane associated rhomboid family serine protease
MLPAVTVVVLLAIWLLDQALHLDLARFGIMPREASGLGGILAAPLLHGDWEHIFNNSTAILALGWCLMYFYPRAAGRVVLFTWLLGGLGVWLMGRTNPHIGASGVIYGMAAFLFMSGLLHRQRTLMALTMLVTFLYGSLIWGILPVMHHVSWESHLWGAVVGLVLAFAYRRIPPAVVDPKPSFADEDDDDAPASGMEEGDEVNEAELVWKRKLAERAERPGNRSTTWDS